jgi:hypothetical protein
MFRLIKPRLSQPRLKTSLEQSCEEQKRENFEYLRAAVWNSIDRIAKKYDNVHVHLVCQMLDGPYYSLLGHIDLLFPIECR